MLTINSLPTVGADRIFLDLGDLQNALPYHYKVEFGYRHLVDNTSVPYSVQINNPESFREYLTRETGLYQYQVNNPLELAPEFRTQRWQKLCDYLDHYSELSKSTQVKVIKLLNSLCFHRAILNYVPYFSETEIANDQDIATLAFSRAIANIIVHSDSYLPYDIKILENIAVNAQIYNPARVFAGILMLAEMAKTFKDLAGAEYWRSFVSQSIEAIKPSLDTFTEVLLTSTYYRGASFVPLMRGEKEQVIAEMDLCQAYSESLVGENQEQKVIAYQNQNIVLESRTKEALWLKDFDLAEERARKLVERCPLESRYWVELGEILLSQGRVEEALQVYRRATRLSPPTAIPWFMAGQCYQSLGELELACDCYLACLRSDPKSISAVRRLSQVASALENQELVRWCQIRLPELEQEKQEMLAMGKKVYAYKFAAPVNKQVA